MKGHSVKVIYLFLHKMQVEIWICSPTSIKYYLAVDVMIRVKSLRYLTINIKTCGIFNYDELITEYMYRILSGYIQKQTEHLL